MNPFCRQKGWCMACHGEGRSSERSLGRPRVIGALVVRGSRKSRDMRPSEHRKNRESAYCGKF